MRMGIGTGVPTIVHSGTMNGFTALVKITIQI